MVKRSLLLTGWDDTARLGAIIGNTAGAGDLIYLDGDLGAGKTTLTKTIAAALGIAPSEVTSPTFTLVHEYRSGRLPLYHFDLYRLSHPSEIENLGFDDYVNTNDGVVVVEWATKASNWLPSDALSLKLIVHREPSDHRTVELTSNGVRSTEILEDAMRLYNC